MTDTPKKNDRYRDTVFLPKTDFPMKAGLPQKEPELLKRWADTKLYDRLRKESRGREKFVLHDGPPYANANIHIGHALNKILKDLVVRTHQMAGFDSIYVPGWDCHGLPIEWKIEEKYRAAGKNKDDIPINEFRKECREFAQGWVDIQREEFKRLGVEGDWDNPYLTMNYKAEAIIAKELLKFAGDGQLYRGSKPVMWSVVEGTSLAEAEIEYEDISVDTIFVKFPVVQRHVDSTVTDGNYNTIPPVVSEMHNTYVVIWTTTPWTIPGNRAISFSEIIDYSIYEVVEILEGAFARLGERYLIADNLAEEFEGHAKIRLRRVGAVAPNRHLCRHPLSSFNEYYAQLSIPLLNGDHVTADAGTGFVHTAPSHGADDYNVWIANQKALRDRDISTDVPTPVGPDGFYTAEAPGFEGARVIDQYGKWKDANARVIEALKDAGMLLAHTKKTISYPHSWRSKKPIIFRNTPQWFISMGDGKADGLRARALAAIEQTKFFPPAGQNRLRGMITDRPDWVISRQRAWGVPIAVFVNKATDEILKDINVNQRIYDSFCEQGADAWYAEGAAKKYLAPDHNPDDYEQVRDILDVWFDSGCTHAFVLEERPDLKWPADVYLEGSDQHRGWFHSSLLESCGTRGRAPYDQVVTHGFTLAEDGRKMSKSLGNTTAPQDVIKNSGADILRLWVATCDYADDMRIGPEILKSAVENYRKLRNTFRYMLGALEGLKDWETTYAKDMPELERYVLHSLHELGETVQAAYDVYDYKKAAAALTNFMNVELSAFYFDIRKDTLYCDPWSSNKRKSCRSVIDQLFHCLVTWWAPIMVFTAEEVWISRFDHPESSVHVMPFAKPLAEWKNDELAKKWDVIRNVRRAVTGALEIERANKRIGSSLEAAPTIYVQMDETGLSILKGQDLAEICITSDAKIEVGAGPTDAFRLDDLKNVAVVPHKAEGQKCARSWKISKDIGQDKDFPDVTPRDAEAVREWQTRFGRVV
jgi:isoleucyl-tRNA synthetase